MNRLARSEFSTTVAIDELSTVAREEMFALLCRHFEGVSRIQFEADLGEKDWALLLHREGQLVGFTTLKVYPADTALGPINVFYSGDTIVDPAAWDSPALVRGWIGMVKRIQESLTSRPCYWLLLSSGFRTYRMLPVFWKTFWPCFGRATPGEIQLTIDALAVRQFGAAYHAREGVVRFPRPQKLKAALAAVPAGRERNAHVAFFLTRNSGHLAGDELVCFTELTDVNLTSAGERVVREKL